MTYNYSGPGASIGLDLDNVLMHDQTYGNNTTLNSVEIEENGFSTTCNHRATLAHTILLILIVSAGVIGNSLSLIILHFKSRPTNFNFLIKVLSCVDIIILLLLPIDRLPFKGKTSTFASLVMYEYIVDKMGGIARFASVWMLIIIAFFRFMAVCVPMKVKLYCTSTNARLCVIGVFILDVAVHIPFYFEHKLVLVENSTSLYYPEPTAWGLSNGFKIYAHVIYTGCMFFILPFVSLILFSILMMRTLYGKEREKYLTHAHLQQEASDVTKVVVAIIVAFMISYTPYLVWTIDEMIPGRRSALGAGDCSKLLYRYIFDLFLYINSSVNFFIYVFFRKTFRKSLYDLFTCKSKSKEEQSIAPRKSTIATDIE